MEKKRRDSYYGELTNIYQKMYRYLEINRRQEPDVYEENIIYVRNKLVANLIQYGTYLKTVRFKSLHDAERTLKRAIAIDLNLPIAHYRLGFLAYREENYVDALNILIKLQPSKHPIKSGL